MSRLQKIDLAIIGQTLLRNQSIGKNGQIEGSKNFPPLIKLEDRNIRIHWELKKV